MISVVIPVYNNAPCLEELVRRTAASLTGQDFEIIFINDGSTDNTLEGLRRLAQADPRVKAISLSRNFGQHPATGAGLEHASGDRIVVMDGDLQDRPEDIPHLLDRLTAGVEIVYTIKSDNSESFLTNFTSRLFHYTYARTTRVSVPNGIGTFRAFTRKFLDALLLYKERNILYGPLMVYMGFPHDSYRVPHEVRAHGKGSYTFLKRLSLAINSLVTYTDTPYQMLMFLGAGTLGFSIVYGLFNLLQYLVAGRILMGGLTVVVMLILFFGGALFTALGLLGIYIFRIFQEVLGRPRCLVAERINFGPATGRPEDKTSAESEAAPELHDSPIAIQSPARPGPR
jgi:dolichol-phosphate mannosyltransferase